MHFTKFTFSVVPGASAPSGTLVCYDLVHVALSHTLFTQQPVDYIDTLSDT